jgi:lysophospholipase L1-like esterase
MPDGKIHKCARHAAGMPYCLFGYAWLQAGIDVLFYGDSITELWRGTAWGYTSRLGGGIPAVFSRYFGQYTSVICGSGGVEGKLT